MMPRDIKLVLSDCDGVLTDGGMYYLSTGDELKKFNVLDGVGFSRLREHNIKTGIITASNTPIIQKRADILKIDYLFMGVSDKLKIFEMLCDELQISCSNVAYIGDDIADIPVLRKCGFGCVPSDALDYVKAEADYITKRRGGDGCFREIADLVIMQIDGTEIPRDI